jgi:hypothetical protein
MLDWESEWLRQLLEVDGTPLASTADPESIRAIRSARTLKKSASDNNHEESDDNP